MYFGTAYAGRRRRAVHIGQGETLRMAGTKGKREGQSRAEQYGPDALDSLRKRHIQKAMKVACNDTDRAAALLGITERELQRLLLKLDLQG